MFGSLSRTPSQHSTACVVEPRSFGVEWVLGLAFAEEGNTEGREMLAGWIDAHIACGLLGTFELQEGNVLLICSITSVRSVLVS